MKYLDPDREPNRWLEAILCQLIDQGDNVSKGMVKQAIFKIVSWTEPGLIDQIFAPWIEQYKKTLDEYKNNQNSVDPECLPVDQLEPLQ